jgi:hypothetical protein
VRADYLTPHNISKRDLRVAALTRRVGDDS